jgi:TRAP-type mannitol/chloroaromatic compound transport system permease large subunit
MRAFAPDDITIIDIYRSVIPFVGVMVLALTLLMVFPEIALWLPEQLYTK